MNTGVQVTTLKGVGAQAAPQEGPRGLQAAGGGTPFRLPAVFAVSRLSGKSACWVTLTRLFFLAPPSPTSSYCHLHSGRELEMSRHGCGSQTEREEVG